MRLTSTVATHVGHKRQNNQDRYLVGGTRQMSHQLHAIADGMGGHVAGEVAAAIAIDVLGKVADHLADEDFFDKAFRLAHAAIHVRMQKDPATAGMGTTLTACALVDTPAGSEWRIGHAGDSVAYLLRGGLGRKLTIDHSSGGGLENCLGVMPDCFKGVEQHREPALVGDVIVLATDGVYGDKGRYRDEDWGRELSNEHVQDVVKLARKGGDLAQVIVEDALRAGGEDNVTVIVVRAS